MDRHTTDKGRAVPPPGAGEARAAEIEQHVERKAWGQVFGLQVECGGGRLVLRGRCRTYHAKQIVQHAALELTASSTLLVNEIVIA